MLLFFMYLKFIFIVLCIVIRTTSNRYHIMLTAYHDVYIGINIFILLQYHDVYVLFCILHM